MNTEMLNEDTGKRATVQEITSRASYVGFIDVKVCDTIVINVLETKSGN